MALELPKIDQLGEKVTGGVKEVIEKVENPKELEARATFGYKPTEKEVKRTVFFKDLFEKIWWIVAVVVVFLILVWNWQHIRGFFDFLTAQPTPTTVIATLPPVTSQVVSSIFAGKARQIDQDMGWLRPELLMNVVYYEAGEVISGQYTGARRYWATAQLPDGPIRAYDFWQLPDGQVLLNGGKPNLLVWRQNLQDYYLRQFFTDQVVMRDEIVDDFPQTLSLSPTMLLYRREVLTDLGPYDGAVVGTGRLALTLMPQEYQRLSSLEARNYSGLTIYSKSYNADELFGQVTEVIATDLEPIADQYLQAGTKVVVTDSTGVGMVYELVFKDQWSNYVLGSLNQDLLNLSFYEQELVKYTATTAFEDFTVKLLAGEAEAYPAGMPGAPKIEEGRPGLSFGTLAVDFDEVRPLFSNFGDAFVATCEASVDTKVVQNLSREELEEIGRISVPQVPLYRLTNNEHQLNQLAHNLKFIYQNLGEVEFATENTDLLIQMKEYDRSTLIAIGQGRELPQLPNTAEYGEKIPLLFFYDPWERPVALWENDIDYLQKCAIIGQN